MPDLAIIEQGQPRLLRPTESVLVPAAGEHPDRKVPVSAIVLWSSAEREAINVKSVIDDPIPARRSRPARRWRTASSSCTGAGR
jgi:hypothetical protein